MSITSGTKRRTGRNAPAVIVIERPTLARTAIVRLLESELIGWNIVDMVSIDTLDRAVGMDVRLITVDLAGRTLSCRSLLDELDAIRDRFGEAPIALLSNSDDAFVASQALKMGVRGFFTTSQPIEIALAGLRLVLAGGIFCPHPMDAAPITAPVVKEPEDSQPIIDMRPHYLTVADFTPREADVLAELRSGSSNKVIAGKLNLSGHTVKMHLQHIMRKLQVQNRTEVVARLGRPMAGQDLTLP